ncbi:hypothetical protein GGS20DRAFT_388176 [Poronia punctata]|nr:hypothetical protein GGS20DRAFT_388176 [Poronia punctata]
MSAQDGPHEAATRSAEEELRRRRERGKLSQARFRKKQSQEIQAMREQNESLKLAISRIVNAAQQGSRQTLFNAIRDAGDIAGINASAITDKSSDSGSFDDSTIADDAAKGFEPVSPENHGLEEDNTTNSSPSTPSRWDNRSNTTERQVHSRAWAASCAALKRKTASRSSRGLSPRLDYGIWIDASRAVRVSEPPPLIAPFLGKGQNTFAGQVFWACADYLIALCRVVTTPRSPCEWFDRQPEKRPGPREAEQRVWSIIQHTPPIGNIKLALTLAEAHLEFREHGHIYGDSPVSNGDTNTLLQRDLEEQYAALGMDMSAWISVRELETHVRQKLGGEAFARLERAIAAHNSKTIDPTCQGLLSSSDVCQIVRLLIKNLAESYVCFGDGPRWRVDSISALFDENMLS